jgi:F420-non-reducing hydrogenase iron-sulfur subunit
MNIVREINTETIPEDFEMQAPPVTAFVCANCARPGKVSTSAGRSKPTVPDFSWPFPVEQVVVPCAGRIQPEHILKTFEAGADMVLIVACEKDNCHYIEGSKRCERRVEFVQSILKEIGLGDERLRLEFLPGSAAEDMMVDAGKSSPQGQSDVLAARIDSVREQTIKAFELLPPNPLRQADADEVTGNKVREGLDTTNDNANK